MSSKNIYGEWKHLFQKLNLSREEIGKLCTAIDFSISDCQSMAKPEYCLKLYRLFADRLPSRQFEVLEKLIKLIETGEEGSEEEEEEHESDEGGEPSKKPRVNYPFLGEDSVTTKVGKPTPKGIIECPLYAHWVAIKLYNWYLSGSKQISENSYPIQFGRYSIHKEDLDGCCQRIQAACKIYECRDQQYNCDGRGVMASPGMRGSEITYTGFYSRELDRFIWPDPNEGACLHQGPTRKQKKEGSPELADTLVLPFDDYHTPGDTFASADSKNENSNVAVTTSVYHSLNIVGVHHNCFENWPVLVSFPNTPGKVDLQIHIAVEDGLWYIPVVSGSPHDKAVLCAMYAAIHFLKDSPVFTQDPLTCYMPTEENLISLKSGDPNGRVFKEGGTVCKYFDTTMLYKPNVDIIKKSSNLKNIKLQNITTDGRIVMLSYDYVSGNHCPTNFIGILKTLKILHDENIVHGDIRLCNLVFTATEGFLIDFDLARTEGCNYPVGYKFYKNQRHNEARSSRPMKKFHDRFSLSYIMKSAGVEDSIADPNVPLSLIIETLEGFQDIQHEFPPHPV